MKKSILILFWGAFSLSVWSQDVLIKTDKSQMEVLIFQVEEDSIVFQYFGDASNQIEKISKSEIWKIFYENGAIEILTNTEEEKAPPFGSEKEETETIIPEEKQEEKIGEPPTEYNDFKRGVFFGLTLGGNLSMARYDCKSGPNPPFPSPKLALSGGLNIDFRLAKWFGFQTNFLYQGKGDRIDMGEYIALIKLPANAAYLSAEGYLTRSIAYAEASLVPIFSFGYPNRFQIGGGPYFGYGIHGKEKSDYTLTYSYNLEYEEEIHNGERKVEFVDLFQEDDQEDIYYVNSWDYGLVTYIGIQEGHSTFGFNVTWSRREWEPDSAGALFGSTFKSNKTKSLVTSFFYTYWFGK